MKLTDSEKLFDVIGKTPLSEKQKKIQEIQKKGFKFDNKEIKEIIKDKWVFVENGPDTDIVDLDSVIFCWEKEEELRIEKEEAESGKTVIDRYFKKYGTLSKKEEPKDGSLYCQTVYFDGKSCPGEGWNTELFMYRMGVHKSFKSWSKDVRTISFYADMDIEDLMDAKMKGDEPTLRHCHDWHTSPHKKCNNHYNHENWLEDIDTAKNIFIKEVNNLLKDFEEFQYSSKKNLFCVPGKFVFWFQEEADHNGDDTSFHKAEIYSKNKYKDNEVHSSTRTVPAKFDRAISRGEIIEMAHKACEDKLTKHNFRKQFKY
jgi:hypothetical protein